MNVSPAGLSTALPATPTEDALYSKVAWHLVPILLIAYIISFIDRVNVGYAQLQMKDALGFSDAVFGLGAGIMFIGYFLFEVPSNILLEKIGARKTLLRIMVLWGLAATATMFVTTATQFYVVRFFLGVFEAGFFPGVILYLTYWFPSARRGKVIAIFMSGTVIASVIAGPISGATMKFMDGLNGWGGWQWLYLTQGLPAIVLGVMAFFWLQDRPSAALWLSSDERAKIANDLVADAPVAKDGGHGRIREILRDPRVYLLALVDFLLIGGSYTMVFWTPTLIKSWGVSDVFEIGLYAAIPNIVGVIGMILMSRSADKYGERRWHFMAATAIAAIGLFITTQTQGMLGFSLAALCLAVFGIASATPLFITATTEYLPKRIAAAGIALITCLGILGGAASPAITGLINTKMGSPVYGMYLVVGLFLMAGLVMLFALPNSRRARRERIVA